jgi:drug/metabolite transporter (DMT)-like permease
MQKITTLKSDGLLLTAAAIWGFSFVAQRIAMLHIGPFTYNGVRFALGSLSLLPLIWYRRHRAPLHPGQSPASRNIIIYGGSLLGLVLFIGSSLQQSGMVYTTAGKGGFITGLYVVLVPILGFFLRKSTHTGTWIGAIVATTGLYLLSITENLSISRGDLLVLLSALFWAVHVLLISWLSPQGSAIRLAALQFAVCSLLSLLTAVLFEDIVLNGILAAAVPILYGGLFSTGIAFTLQIVAQKRAHPSHAAIILSLEGAFAALGGWLIMAESFSLRGWTGCLLMLAGMLISQLNITSGLSKWLHTRSRNAG